MGVNIKVVLGGERNKKGNIRHKIIYIKYIISVKHNYLFLSTVHIATCFDSKESSSAYSMNNNIDTSSDGAHFGIPKSLHGKIQVKLLQNYCADVLNSN